MTIKTHWWQLITVTNQSSLIETFKCYLLVSITFALFPSKVWFSTNKSYPNYRDGGGTIDSSEVTEMLKGLFSMAGVSEPTSWDNSDTFFLSCYGTIFSYCSGKTFQNLLFYFSINPFIAHMAELQSS